MQLEPYDQAVTAIEKGDTKSLRRLLRSGLDVDERGEYAWAPPLIYVAAHARNSHALKLLVDAGAEPDQLSADGESALMLAARIGFAEGVVALTEAGASPNIKSSTGLTAIDYAFLFQNTECILTLIASDVDELQVRALAWPLYFAASDLPYPDDIKVVEALVAKGYSSDVRDQSEITFEEHLRQTGKEYLLGFIP